jgi:hypothetical protein
MKLKPVLGGLALAGLLALGRAGVPASADGASVSIWSICAERP